MRFLALLFLAGFALAAAVPLQSYDHEVEYAREVEDFFQDLAFEADDDIKTELGKKLKEHLDQILEKIREAIDHGKGVKEDYLDKMREIKDKLKDLKIDIGNKARDLLDKVKDKAKDYWQKIKDILNPDTRSLDEDEFSADDIKTELGKKLKERFDEIMEKVKDAIEQGKGVKEDTLEKLKEIRGKLKDLKIDIGDKAKELIEKLKEKAKDYWQKILDKIGGKEKRDVASADFNIKGIFKKLKELIKSKIDKEALKEKIEQIFGKGSEMADELLRVLKEKGEKGKKKLLALIDRLLGDEEEKRSIKEVYDKIKDYFRELNIELKEKFSRFGEYVKEKYQKGLEKGKTRVENLKNIAKKFLDDSRDISRDVAREALEFFKEYKEDLGRLFDHVRTKVKAIINKDL